MVFNTDPVSDAWNWVFDCVNDARHPDFTVGLEIATEGRLRPAKQKIVAPLEAWLSALDYGRALADQQAGQPLPRTQLTAGDWILDYTAHAVSPDRRGIPGRLIASYPPMSVNFTRDVTRLRTTLSDKGAKYGTLDQPLDKPLVVAIACGNSIDESEVVDAFFGSGCLEISWDGRDARRFRRRDGYWRPKPEPRGTRISAVLFGDVMHPWTVAAELPRLWLNPCPLNPLEQPLPLASINVDRAGNLARTEPSLTAAELFALPPGWPNGPAKRSATLPRPGTNPRRPRTW